jgi:hypothetical protein
VHLPSGDTEAGSSRLRFERGARLGVESQVVVTERGHSHDCLIGGLHDWRPKAAVGLVTRKPPDGSSTSICKRERSWRSRSSGTRRNVERSCAVAWLRQCPLCRDAAARRVPSDVWQCCRPAASARGAEAPHPWLWAGQSRRVDSPPAPLVRSSAGQLGSCADSLESRGRRRQ